MIVGITGCYCSGKNTVCDFFAKQGYSIIDVDRIGYNALEAKREEIVYIFGKKILLDKRIDRKKLGSIVFGDLEKRRELEKIVHPWMIKTVKELIDKKKNSIINAALLIEMCLFVLCDIVIGIDVREEHAIERGIERDHLPRDEILKRLRAQIPLKEKLHYVDKIIENNQGIDEFRKKVAAVYREIQNKIEQG